MEQTNGNVAAPEVKKAPTALDTAKERFAARKAPAAEKEVKAAWKAYFDANEKVGELQKQLEAAMADRTTKTKELVQVRGAAQQNITGKGVGRFMARGDSAWVLFPSDSDAPALTL